MQLVTEAVVKELGVPGPSVAGLHAQYLDEPTAAASFLLFLTLTQSADLFLKAGWPAETIFWSRYFWFKRFATIQLAKGGPDAGLEQQALQLLEHPFPPCEPDWSKLESVEKSARANDAPPNTSLKRTSER